MIWENVMLKKFPMFYSFWKKFEGSRMFDLQKKKFDNTLKIGVLYTIFRRIKTEGIQNVDFV